MFGLTFEKLIVITFIVAVVVGPQRLPLYATKLAAIIRVVRDAAETAKVRAQNELGFTVDAAQWSRKLQQYDPRRIIQETLAEDNTKKNSDAQSHHAELPDDSSTVPKTHSTEYDEEATSAQLADEHSDAEAARRWMIVGGSSGHPQRRRIAPTASGVAPRDAMQVDPQESGT